MYCTWMYAHTQNSNNSRLAHFVSHCPRPKTLDVATPDHGIEASSKRRPSDMQTVIGKNRNLKKLVASSHLLCYICCLGGSFVTSYSRPSVSIAQPPLPWQVPRPRVNQTSKNEGLKSCLCWNLYGNILFQLKTGKKSPGSM